MQGSKYERDSAGCSDDTSFSTPQRSFVKDILSLLNEKLQPFWRLSQNFINSTEGKDLERLDDVNVGRIVENLKFVQFALDYDNQHDKCLILVDYQCTLSLISYRTNSRPI